MAILGIHIHNRTHQIACNDGEESHVRKLADEIDARVKMLAQQMGGQAPDGTLLVLAALMLCDELNEQKENNQKLKLQLGNNSQSFEQAKQQEVEMQVAEAIADIADDIEKIAKSIETKAA